MAFTQQAKKKLSGFSKSKRTSIGLSSNTRYNSKNDRKNKKRYARQG
jgi:hypothetical protein